MQDRLHDCKFLPEAFLKDLKDAHGRKKGSNLEDFVISKSGKLLVCCCACCACCAVPAVLCPLCCACCACFCACCAPVPCCAWDLLGHAMLAVLCPRALLSLVSVLLGPAAIACMG